MRSAVRPLAPASRSAAGSTNGTLPTMPGTSGSSASDRLEQGTERRLRRGIAEHEVERLGPDGRRHRLVPVPNDPEVDDVVGVRARGQVPGDPERELVAGLVAFEQRPGEAQERDGVAGAEDLHRTMLAGGQSDHRPASSASTPLAAASGVGAPERSSVAST